MVNHQITLFKSQNYFNKFLKLLIQEAQLIQIKKMRNQTILLFRKKVFFNLKKIVHRKMMIFLILILIIKNQN